MRQSGQRVTEDQQPAEVEAAQKILDSVFNEFEPAEPTYLTQLCKCYQAYLYFRKGDERDAGQQFFDVLAGPMDVHRISIGLLVMGQAAPLVARSGQIFEAIDKMVVLVLTLFSRTRFGLFIILTPQLPNQPRTRGPNEL